MYVNEENVEIGLNCIDFWCFGDVVNVWDLLKYYDVKWFGHVI